MHIATSLLSAQDESDALDTLLSPDINKYRFQNAVRQMHTLFRVYACTSPEPLPAPGLIVTPEIRAQCELYLPIADIAAAFNHLYSAALTYQPILSSTPFHNALSWADAFAALPVQFQFSANPARLMESLLDDEQLLTRFLFASFLPRRFYGGIGRYPEQRKFVRKWLTTRIGRTLRCLDAACGTGEDTYGLALLLMEQGFLPESIRIDGWTLEPLEVWAASHRRLPHDRQREAVLRGTTAELFRRGYDRRISFSCQDILNLHSSPISLREHGISQEGENSCFALILFNGLLGGPIIHDKAQVNRAVGNLAQLLGPGGILLAADNFHGGWKQKCPQSELRASFETHGLKCVECSEGIGGLKPD